MLKVGCLENSDLDTSDLENLDPLKIIEIQFRPQSPLSFWSAPRTRTLARSKAGSPRIKVFRLVYADSEIWNNGGCRRLLEWTFTATAHKLEMARVRFLGADQLESVLWGRDWLRL